MLLFKSDLLILFILSLSFISINCHLNDTEITTIDSLIDNEGSSIDADEPSEHSNAEIKDQSSSLPPSSSTAAKNLDETRTQPTPTDDIKDDENNSSAANKAENNNESNDDSLFSISPGASSSSPLDKTGNDDKLVSNNDNEANENDEDNENDSPASSSTESSKKAETDSKSPTSKINYEECVALGNENCGTPPEDSESSEESDSPKLNTNVDNKPKQPNETSINNQINNDESKSNEAQEQKSKHFWYEDVPLKLGLPFVLVLFVLFVIIFLLFLVFLIQDSFSRKNDNSQNNETVKIKTGYGTQKFNMNQLQMLEKRMRAARDEVDLHEVNVQGFNKKDDSDDQNNNVPNENAFENIALQDKQNSSRM